MILSTIDWIVIAVVLIATIGIGIWASKSSGRSFNDYFLSGGNMPWWLLGMSMVATTFGADTPNLVTDIVRTNGVSGNWTWWAFLLTGLLTVFLYAKLWKRSGLKTDLEFYEVRYSGKPATFLRGFRAVYLGVVFNCIIMATVILAGIKIGGILLGLQPLQVVLISGIITVIYTMLGGLKGVIYTDFFQFILAMIGAIGAAIYVLKMPEVGGLSNLLDHADNLGKTALIPDISNWEVFVPLMIVPLAVQWWASWYPGAEPGGGGYIAQRMLSAKSESHAVRATLLFNMAHYALRPWPWILVALASLMVFPTLDSIQSQFPNIDSSIIDHDLAYPAMLSFLPKGLLGIVIASLIAAFMSTISTHLNWGASYLTNDVYRRFVEPKANENKLVNIGRLTTVMLMFISGVLALYMESALDSFNIILQIGAGTGLIYILRWFWWRINAYTEIAGMIFSFLIALIFRLTPISEQLGLEGWHELVLGVGITTIAWLIVTFLTRPTEREVLQQFYKRVRPDSGGWKPIAKETNIYQTGEITTGLKAMFVSIFMIYSALFGTGFIIYGKYLQALIALIVVVISIFILKGLWPKLNLDQKR